MFIFNRPFTAVAAGLGVALFAVYLDSLRQPPDIPLEVVPQQTAQIRPERPEAEAASPAPVRDLSVSCRLPAARLVQYLAGLKARIVSEQQDRPQRSGSSLCAAARSPPTQFPGATKSLK
jgi:hypothetical protein